jgi:hypothetical protein
MSIAPRPELPERSNSKFAGDSYACSCMRRIDVVHSRAAVQHARDGDERKEAPHDVQHPP